MEPDLHPNLAPLSGLLGTWRGEGSGEYPTVSRFGYREEIRFWHVGKPFLLYSQETWSSDDDRPLHGETGFWRATGEGKLEVVLAHALGITEVSEGRVSSGVIETVSTSLGLSSTAKEVTRLERRYELEGDALRYELRMAAMGEPLTFHLSAELRRMTLSP